MTGPVNAADVLMDFWDQSSFDDDCEDEVRHLLALGAGDPVVIMPDGTLQRLDCAPRTAAPGGGLDFLTDPVQP